MKWWLSYATDEGFLGVVIADIDDALAGQTITIGPYTRVDTEGFLHAVQAVKRRGVSPGGEVRGYKFPESSDDTMETFRLYSREELVELGLGVSTRDED